MKKIIVLSKGLAVLVITLLVAAGVLALVANHYGLATSPVGVPVPSDAKIYDSRFAAAIESIRETLPSVRTRLTAPALSLSVGWNGSLIWSEALGFADVPTARPVEIESLFPIGSISKSLTAVTALRLVEKALIDLDEDVRSAVPSFARAAWPVTLRQLLSHQAGIRHYRFAWTPPVFNETAFDIEFDTVTDGLSLFVDDPLLFEPDTSFQYSTFGYSLAAAFLESKTAKPFLEIVSDEVLTTADLDRTRADRVAQRSLERVSTYHSLFGNGDVLPEPSTNPSYKWAGGGYLSTPEDLVTFGNAILTGQLLGSATRDLMFTPRRTSDGELNPQHYGLGWRIGGLSYPAGSDTIIPLINHGGTTLGAVSILLLLPDSGLVVAMSANSASRRGSGALTREAAVVARAFLNHIASTDLESSSDQLIETDDSEPVS